MKKALFLIVVFTMLVLLITSCDGLPTITVNNNSSNNVNNAAKSTSSNQLVDGMRPEFKRAMDSYEDFFDDYCEFMKKYENSHGTEVINEYLDFLSKYAETMEKLNEISEDELNNKELAYYTDVMTRINKKLASIY